VGASSDSASPSPTHANWCAQDRLEAVLLEALAKEPGAQVCFGTELVSFRAADGVTAVVGDLRSGERTAVRARYLVGADGANSRVREVLGIAMRGQTGLSSELNILFEAKLEPLLGGRRLCMYRINGVHASGVLRPTGRPDRWLFGTTGDADTSHERVVETIRAGAGHPKLAVKIIAVGAWEACAQVADRFARGRCS
jgi:putative polyketide hydroxylase